MAKAKKTKEVVEKLAFTIIDIDNENGTFIYLDENGDECEGELGAIFTGIKLPFDVTLKTGDKEDLDVQFKNLELENEDD